jgi:hypothetical protein
MHNSKLLVLAFIAVSLPQTASAQRFGSRTNSLVSLAANEAVQKELAMTEELVARLDALNEESRAASQREFSRTGIDFSAISDLPALERAAEMRKLSEKTTEISRQLAAQFQPKLVELLSPQQMNRLKQIQLQASGIDVWLEPEWAKPLDLSDAQKSQLTALRAEYSRKVQQLDGDFQQRIARTRELNAERDKHALDLLSDDQKARLKELQGPPFDTTQLGFRRRGNN